MHRRPPHRKTFNTTKPRHAWGVFLHLCAAMVCVLLIGCSSPRTTAYEPTGDTNVTQPQAEVVAETSPVETPHHDTFERDRSAILQLAGTFAVTFEYQEANPLRGNYEVAKPYTARATEHIVVVEDSPNYIALQHLLVMGEPAIVVKHWREDWAYSPETVYQHLDENTWALRPYVTAGQPGTWTRTAFGPDDAPQYGVWGKWSHVCSVSSWASTSAVFSPKPRREAERSDYAVLSTEDRVTLSPAGWSQEQLHTKTFFFASSRNAPSALVREAGIVRYQRLSAAEAVDTQRIALDYWNEYQVFWAEVRLAWARLFERGTPVVLMENVDGQPRWRRLFELAQGGDPDVAASLPARLDALLQLYRVEP